MAEQLAAALCVDVRVAHAALQETRGDVDAAAAVLLASGACSSTAASGAPAQQAVGGSGALEVLVQMGFPRAAAQQALARTGGDVGGAVALLSDASGGAHAQACPAPGSAQSPEAEDCPICCEPVQPQDAAMRCDGRGGAYHYGHAACLARWVQRCRADNTEPTCPTCRGALQLHRRRLQDFLQQRPEPASGPQTAKRGASRRRLSSEDSELLQSMLDQTEGDDGWCEVRWDHVAGFMLGAAALVGVGLLAKGIFDHLANKRDRRR